MIQRSTDIGVHWLSLDVIRWSLSDNRLGAAQPVGRSPKPAPSLSGRLPKPRRSLSAVRPSRVAHKVFAMNHSKRLMLCLLSYASERDLTAEDIFLSAGVDWRTLYDETVPLSAGQIGQIWMECIRLSGDPLFGLHFGEALQLSALGVVGEVIKTSATVGSALELSFSLVSTITSTFQVSLRKSAGAFTVHFHPTDDDWKEQLAYYQTLDLLIVFLIHELDGLLIRRIKPLRVSYWREPADPAELQRVFRCTAISVAPEVSITFDISYWNEPIISANYKLQQVLLKDFMKPVEALAPLGNLKAQVKDYLMRNAYLGVLSLEDAAGNFNLGVRTLQRRLKEEDCTFDSLADEVRRTMAIGYIQSGTYPIKEVSMMLGYNDLSNFSRSFKRWTGVSPSDYATSG
jgi:AraC-like DNA-binding protein